MMRKLFDGLSVDRTTGKVDQPRLPRFKGHTNYDNYVAAGTRTKIGISNIDYNGQSALDVGSGRFAAPGAGTYLLCATLLRKVNSSTHARMRGRLVLKGTTKTRDRGARFPGRRRPVRQCPARGA